MNARFEQDLKPGTITKEELGQKDAVLCDRCSTPMFRMRAVYWCEKCGYKTDCCGH